MRSTITTALDSVGAALIVVGLGLLFGIAAALIAAGLGVIVVSWQVSR